MNTDYDVIIAGGGLAGLTTATSIAKHSNQQARVLVVDRNPESSPGQKTISGWVCGDAVSKKSVDYIAKHLDIQYSSPEIEHEVKGVLMFSPDRTKSVLFEGEGYVLNRKLLASRQVNEAKKLGVEFRFLVALTHLKHQESSITGVVGRNIGDNSSFDANAKIVVDATGSASKLRANLPINSFIQKEIDKNDLESTGRYIYEFTPGKEDKTFFDPDYCIIHLDQDLAPGGYCWTFPKGVNKVNVGLGVQKKSLDLRNSRLGKTDNLPTLINNYVESNPVLKNPVLSKSSSDEGNTRGNWQVSVRRQNDCMVANGYALVGDAAWMARPIDAGGIGPSFYGGVILGKVISNALNSNDFSESSLWPYNVEYVQTYGYQMPSFDVFRRYLQTLSNDQINYGVRNFLSDTDIQLIIKREHPTFNKVKLFNPMTWVKIARQYKLAKGLRTTSKTSELLIQHCLNYPQTPAEFPAWQNALKKILGNAFLKLGIA